MIGEPQDEQEDGCGSPRKNARTESVGLSDQPFALWFLTSIAVGLLTWSYSEWQAVQTRPSKKIDNN